ncbi:MAG TPA: VOC family protein [Arenimonas sp.]|nr:VOC family protein [Arenimonas sp.]
MKPSLRKITAVLPVAAIEPSLPFWEAVGLTRTVEVPHGDALGFVILAGRDLEVMLQTHASIADDMPSLAEAARQGPTFLFVEVDDIDAIERALAGRELAFPRRTTFYGATEVGYREPGGHYVTFAQFPPGE